MLPQTESTKLEIVKQARKREEQRMETKGHVQPREELHSTQTESRWNIRVERKAGQFLTGYFFLARR